MFKQVNLTYDFGALEPHIDRLTMETHYGKHHASYTQKLNDAVSKLPALAGKTIEDILSNLSSVDQALQTAIRNNGGGYYNHNLYFSTISPTGGGVPDGALAKQIGEEFGSFDAFQEKISAAADIVPVLEKMVQVGKRDLVIISEDIDGEALATLVLNKIRGMVNVLAVKAPGFGDRRKAMLQDIATLTGAQVISEETGRKLETTTINDLGRAEKVVADKDNTTVVGGKGDEAAIKGRIDQIKVEIDKTTSDYDREKLQERLAKLAGGVAIIRVGAATETELKEKKHRVEDALSATRAAVEEGIVPGGGVALINAIHVLEDLKMQNDDEQIGVNIVRKALEVPMRKITENAGKEGSVIIENVRKAQKDGNNLQIGYDVLTDQYGDMVKCGVIDPAKVTRGALENAASIAAMILTTEALITDVPEENKMPAGPPMPEY